MNNTGSLPKPNHCWSTIGVSGDRSCAELQQMIHCRNCPVYANAGRSLLDREVPLGYLSEVTELLATEQTSLPSHTVSLVIFRLGMEWLALPSALFKEVTPPCVIHTLPHRSNDVLLGLVNIRGEIQLCISLANLLSIEPQVANSVKDHLTYRRMVVVEKEGNSWVFAVDELEGIQRIALDELGNVPATVSKAGDTYTKSIVNWQNRQVSCLDDELLFYTLNRRTL